MICRGMGFVWILVSLARSVLIGVPRHFLIRCELDVIHQCALLLELLLSVDQIFQGHTTQHAQLSLPDTLPHTGQDRIGTSVAMPSPAGASGRRRRQWTIERLDDIGQRNLSRKSAQHIAALRSSEAVHKPGLLHGMQHLFEEPRRYGLPP